MVGATATAEISDISQFLNDDNLLNLNLSGNYDPDIINLFFKMEHCNHLKEYLEEQKKIMARHLDKHKYYQHIADPSNALQDFIDKYAWVMREMYCDKICQENKSCMAYQNYLNKITDVEKKEGLAEICKT